MTENMLTVSSSPHIQTNEDTRSIMLDVIIALLPALAISVFFFGWRALTLTVTSVAACLFFEWLYRKLMKKPQAIGDLSAVVTGILLAYNLPASAPYWLPVVGAFFGIVIVKQLYGGLGKNFMNPALAARAFLFSWPALMNLWPQNGVWVSPFEMTPTDVVTAATPLVSLKKGAIPSDFSPIQMLLGQHGGSLGETSALILLLGGVYLLVRRVISARIPLAYIGTVAVLTFLFPPAGVEGLQWMIYHVLSGGLMLGAIFMATDYATSPVTARGQWLFGIGCGLLTVFIRYFGSYAEGVSYSILIMNACVWLIDKIGKKRRFGTGLWQRRGGKKA